MHDLDSLRVMMKLIADIRDRESSMEFEITPIMNMYAMLDLYLPAGYKDQEENDRKTVLRNNWKKLLKNCEGRAVELNGAQTKYKRQLLKDVKEFKADVSSDYFNPIIYI